MADPQGLNVTGLKIGQRTGVDPQSGKAVLQHTVQYMVGAHGPFVDTYPSDKFSPAAVTTGINKTVAGIREITTAVQAS
jgi:hypothetical protein